MQIVCLDLEGVLIPEIWIEFSDRSGIPELAKTTRDEPDYDKLMRYRLEILGRERDLGGLVTLVAGVPALQDDRPVNEYYLIRRRLHGYRSTEP